MFVCVNVCIKFCIGSMVTQTHTHRMGLTPIPNVFHWHNVKVVTHMHTQMLRVNRALNATFALVSMSTSTLILENWSLTLTVTLTLTVRVNGPESETSSLRQHQVHCKPVGKNRL